MHASHESGRDADVAFYLRAPNGDDALPPRLVVIGSEGKSPDGALAFDDERNWAFSVHLKAPRPRDARVRRRAPEGAPARPGARRRCPRALVARAEALLSQPRGSFRTTITSTCGSHRADRRQPECVEGVRRGRR
jgi:penicillin-insensitive murein endopeptidase